MPAHTEQDGGISHTDACRTESFSSRGGKHRHWASTVPGVCREQEGGMTETCVHRREWNIISQRQGVEQVL